MHPFTEHNPPHRTPCHHTLAACGGPVECRIPCEAPQSLLCHWRAAPPRRVTPRPVAWHDAMARRLAAQPRGSFVHAWHPQHTEAPRRRHAVAAVADSLHGVILECGRDARCCCDRGARQCRPQPCILRRAPLAGALVHPWCCCAYVVPARAKLVVLRTECRAAPPCSVVRHRCHRRTR